LLVAVTGLLAACGGPSNPNDMGDMDEMMEQRRK